MISDCENFGRARACTNSSTMRGVSHRESGVFVLEPESLCSPAGTFGADA